MDKVLIGVAGVVLGALLTLLREYWNDHRARKKRAAYLAIRVTCILERFVENCVSVAGDDGYEGEDGCLRPMSSPPEVNIESLDVDWQALPFELMYEILNFPSHIEEANSLIDSIIEHVASPPDFDEWFEERQFQYSKLGLMANSLSTELRAKYAMPKRKYKYWDPVEYLEEKKAKIDRLKAEKEKQRNEFMKRMAAE